MLWEMGRRGELSTFQRATLGHSLETPYSRQEGSGPSEDTRQGKEWIVLAEPRQGRSEALSVLVKRGVAQGKGEQRQITSSVLWPCQHRDNRRAVPPALRLGGGCQPLLSCSEGAVFWHEVFRIYIFATWTQKRRTLTNSSKLRDEPEILKCLREIIALISRNNKPHPTPASLIEKGPSQGGINIPKLLCSPVLLTAMIYF